MYRRTIDGKTDTFEVPEVCVSEVKLDEYKSYARKLIKHALLEYAKLESKDEMYRIPPWEVVAFTNSLKALKRTSHLRACPKYMCDIHSCRIMGTIAGHPTQIADFLTCTSPDAFYDTTQILFDGSVVVATVLYSNKTSEKEKIPRYSLAIKYRIHEYRASRGLSTYYDELYVQYSVIRRDLSGRKIIVNVTFPIDLPEIKTMRKKYKTARRRAQCVSIFREGSQKPNTTHLFIICDEYRIQSSSRTNQGYRKIDCTTSMKEDWKFTLGVMETMAKRIKFSKSHTYRLFLKERRIRERQTQRCDILRFQFQCATPSYRFRVW